MHSMLGLVQGTRFLNLKHNMKCDPVNDLKTREITLKARQHHESRDASSLHALIFRPLGSKLA
jgi:hypothetical protein